MKKSGRQMPLSEENSLRMSLQKAERTGTRILRAPAGYMLRIQCDISVF
jgi:hypothetical protein